MKCRPAQPQQDLFCMGKITKLEVHYNPGKNEVEIHASCQAIKESWPILGYRPPPGYRKNANK